MGTPLSPKYIPSTYMDPLGKHLGAGGLLRGLRPDEKSVAQRLDLALAEQVGRVSYVARLGIPGTLFDI